MGEVEPLMDVTGTRNTTSHFLRSFSIVSADSDFDELTSIPDTPDDFIDASSDYPVHPNDDSDQGVVIPFSNIHRTRGFETIRKNCWIPGQDVTVKIITVEHEQSHSYILNPYLYTIQVSHGDFSWVVRRRYKHIYNLHQQLALFRARINLLPVPTKQNRERRQSLHRETKATKASRFPKRPEILIREEQSDKRREHLEAFLQNILKCKLYRNHSETIKFFEVSPLSFVQKLGKKWKEGAVMKCSGGRRISIGCCGCLKKFHFAGHWSKRWLVVKDTFLTYLRPKDGIICDVLLMDPEFKVKTGTGVTGAHHGLLVTNKNRNFLAKCWTRRKAEEWKSSIEAASKQATDFTMENRYGSFAPVREESYVRWFVDGMSYFEAVADALEKAKEEIFITDWWLSPEIYLKRPVTGRDHWRLDNIIKRKADDGVKIFVLLYKEMEIALTINSRYSKHKLSAQKPENIKVLRHPDHIAGGVYLWAHHEKLVVIDQKIAFLGGIDLCYGRWDDNQHRLTDLGSIHHPGHNNLSEETATTNISLDAQVNDTSLTTDSAVPASRVKLTFTPCSPDKKEKDCTFKQGSEEIVRRDTVEKKDLCVCHKSEEQNRHSYSNLSLEADELEVGTECRASSSQVHAEVHPHVDNSHVEDDGTNVNVETHRVVSGTKTTDSHTVGLIDKHVCIWKPSVVSGSSKKICSTDIDSVPDDFVYYINHDMQNKAGVDSSSEHINTKRLGSKKTAGVHFNKTEMIKEESVESVEDEIDCIDVKDKQPLEPVRSAPVGSKSPAGGAAGWRHESLLVRRLHRGESQKEGKDDKEENNNDEANSNEATQRTDIVNRWRLVLNIQKFESAIRNPQVRTSESIPDSVILPELKTSTAPGFSNRIKQNLQDRFGHHKRDSIDDVTDLDEDSQPAVLLPRTRSELAIDKLGMSESTRVWIGKDYVNFIHKDFVDVQNPFEDFIERTKTPRMPWHDIGAVVYGKSARDVARHFISRWNFTKIEKCKGNNNYPMLLPKSYSKCTVPQKIKDITFQASTQILRSSCGWSVGVDTVEQSIHTAYLNAIINAKHYIYIENQFFVSIVEDHSIVKNEITDALCERIIAAYKRKETFRVYVVMPLLPAFEGEIGKTRGGFAICAVLNWNYSSMSWGSNSLWGRLQQEVDDPLKYVVFCGLRTHSELEDKLVTELVYVHSKLLIVDDDTVIIGSANINDRSMLGDRDSELAVLVEDTQKFPVKMNGKRHMAGRFASSLRKTLFREHLGLSETCTSVDLSDPICDSFYKNVWILQASMNTSIYEKVFHCVPTDSARTFDELEDYLCTPPLVETNPVKAREEIAKVKGYVVLMPLHFLDQESNILPAMKAETLLPTITWT